MRIAVLGPKGTFSDKAYLQYNTDSKLEPLYCNTIDEVFHEVETGCDFGIVPIENTLDGYVQRTLDLLLENDVEIIAENVVSVQFSMIGNVKDIGEIKELFVQFKANGQCRGFISSLSNVNIVTTESNMDSYYRLDGKKGSAAIVPAHIAEKETERFVIENVTDADKNHTRFVIFKKGSVYPKDIEQGKRKLRIPVYIMPATDRPGILFEILKGFHDRKINMISIMSRPTRQEMGTYNFYIEIDGEADRLSDIQAAFDLIREHNKIKVLGIYEESHV